ncbi:MAG: PD-(D/E)XK nuclease family protein, partial [Bacteroidota bacterium]|nr:PD-(D/E)XK nuclease family protein [Bacteroidota bacterium]
LEDYFKPFMEKNLLVTSADVQHMRQTLAKKVKQSFQDGTLGNLPEQGMNYLLYKIATQVLENYLKQQQTADEMPLRILKLEQVMETQLAVPVNGETITVKIAGKADRIDQSGSTIRVIDYKTGLVRAPDLKITPEEMDTHFLTNRHYDKVRQLWLYRYLMAKQLQADGKLNDSLFPVQIEAGIISFRNLNAGVLMPDMQINENKNDLPEFIQTSEKYLREFVQQMLDPTQPIRKTHDLEVCQYCPYRGICAR